MLTKLLTFFLYVVSAAKHEPKSAEGVTLTQWFSLIISRGVYYVLLCLIVICVLVSAYRNKKNQRRLRNEIARTRKTVLGEVSDESNNWVTNLWKGPQFFSLQDSELINRNRSSPLLEFSESDADTQSLNEKLKEAEITVNALQQELEIANKARLDLENAMENMERDKSCTDEELRKIKLNASLELEEMKKEINSLHRQLAIAQTEKSQLTKELEAASRENRITDSALRDQQNLTARLDEARIEIKNLKEMMENMRSERDAAVKVASELVAKAKGVTKESAESRKLIRDILETTTRNPSDEDNDDEELNLDEGSQFENTSFYQSANNSPMDSDTSRLVTNSPEFRAFLQAAFRVSSLQDED